MARDRSVRDGSDDEGCETTPREQTGERPTGENSDSTTIGGQTRRSYLQLTGTAAVAAAGIGMASSTASAAAGTDPEAYLDSADDTNRITFDGNWEQWFTNTHGGDTQLTTDHDRDGNALRVNWSPGNYYGATMEYLMLDNHGYQPDAGHVRYWVYFPDGWEFHPDGLGGTKLPGFAATYQTGDHDIGPGGYGGRPSNGTNGWSARVFNCRPDRADGQGPIGLGSQVYHAGDGGQHGAHPIWNGALDTGSWHRIDQYVEMNEPGVADGAYRTWIDGSLALEMEGLYFRDEGYGDLIGIQTLWAMFYFGGDWGSPVSQHMVFDDVELWLWEDRANVSTDTGTESPADDGEDSEPDEDADDADDETDIEDEYEERFSYKSGSDRSSYQLYVDGEIVQYEWGYATYNDDVEIETVEIDGTAYERVAGEVDADTWNGYYFTGDIVAIASDPEPDELWITGEQISIDDYPDTPGDEGEEPLEHTILIDGVGTTGESQYEFTVDGAVEKSTYRGASINDDDAIDGQYVTGSVTGWRDAYQFSGELSSLEVDGEARVSVNDERVNTDAYSDDHVQDLTIVGNGTPSAYTVAVDGQLELRSGGGASVTSETTGEGTIERGVHRYQLIGTLVEFTYTAGGTHVYLDTDRIDPDEYNGYSNN